MEGELALVRDPEYFLCESSESKMHRALRQRKVILLGETLLFKFEGRLGAIALRSEGCFEKGFWYCPWGKKERRLWRELYQSGVLVYPYITGSWVKVRESRKKFLNDSLIKKSTKLARVELSDRKKHSRVKGVNEEKLKHIDY